MRAIRRSALAGAALLALFVSTSAGCASQGAVTRMVDGRRVRGRSVADEAYAAYLRGVMHEARGELDAAAIAYGEAIHEDGRSAEAWTRLGVLRCTHEGDPWQAFARAQEIDPVYEETWTESARCHLAKGELDDALRAAKIAVSLDPDRLEPVVVLARILERLQRREEAEAWLDGMIIRRPGSIEAQEAMLDFAKSTGNDARKRRAEEALRELRPESGARTGETPPALADVDAALLSDDGLLARRLALALHLGIGGLALRAAALGLADLAREEAELVLAADPTDADARVAAAVAADLLRNDAALRRALAGMPPELRPLSPLARALLSELLARRIGAGDSPTSTSHDALGAADPLTQAVRARR
jgi:tetratricopeptide (TPR) repeat protein